MPPPTPAPPVASIDQCQVTPALPACAAIAPPTVDEPVKPVQLAANELIAAVQRPAQQLGGGATEQAPAGTTGPAEAGAPPPAEDKDKKGSEESAAATPAARTDKPTVKNYCN